MNELIKTMTIAYIEVSISKMVNTVVFKHRTTTMKPLEMTRSEIIPTVNHTNIKHLKASRLSFVGNKL